MSLVESDRDRLTVWFHNLAELEPDELSKLASEENREKFLRYIERNVPDHAPPRDLTDEQFAEAIVCFRRNESEWNHALMAALIRSDDLLQQGLLTQAAAELDLFATSCPWVLFKEVALNQASHYQ